MAQAPAGGYNMGRVARDSTDLRKRLASLLITSTDRKNASGQVVPTQRHETISLLRVFFKDSFYGMSVGKFRLTRHGSTAIPTYVYSTPLILRTPGDESPVSGYKRHATRLQMTSTRRIICWSR